MGSILQTAANAPHPPDLTAGDVLLFVRPTLRQALPYGWAGITAWLSGVITMRAQRRLCGSPQGHDDGLHEISHCGIVVDWLGSLHVYEAVPNVLRLTPLATRMQAAHWTVLSMPLSDEYKPMFDAALVDRFIEAHLHDSYRWGGLPLAVLNGWLGTLISRGFRATLVMLCGYDPDAAEFCSELVIRLLQCTGIVPRALPGWRKGEVVQDCELRAIAYAPCEVARLPQWKRKMLRVVHKGV